jgi:hypothetical protein
MKNIDTVNISKTDFLRLALTLPETESFDDNTLSAPELPETLPLPYFKILYDFEDDVDVDYFAVYEPPMGDEEIRFTVYVRYNDAAPPVAIMAMGVFDGDDGVKALRFSVSPQFEKVARSRLGSAYDKMIESDIKWHTDRFCVFGHLYSVVQDLLLNRPVMLLRQTERRAPTHSSNGKKHIHPPKRKVESFRTITVNYDALTKFESERPPREFSCLAWGVIGHWRNYKNGKRVWVNHYVKGKERDKPESYDGKEYVMREPKVDRE